MLAEPRRKQKWTLNPRGKDWSNDTTKFGQKMLEKMGWTAGKGLGVNEQGMREHVSIKVKNDTIGIGFKNDQDKAWTEHQKAFDNFLSHLQENQDSNMIKNIKKKDLTANSQSLELKSKQSRARVHYQKFTRGKDVKKYSAKDLADILGGKNILKKESDFKEQQEDTDLSNNENGTEGSFTINRGSIADYFKKKTSHFLKDKDNNNAFSKETSDSESEQYRGFGFVPKTLDSEITKRTKVESSYIFDNPALDLHCTNDNIIEEKIKGPNKRKGEFCTENDIQNIDKKSNLIKKLKIDNDISSCKGFINVALDLDNQVTQNHIPNKFEVTRMQLGLTNDALDLTDETCDKKRVTFNDHVEYSTDSIKKKKCTGKLDKFEVDSKKKKKKQKQIINTDISNKIGFVNEALDINCISEESRDNEANEYKSKKNKQKKKQKQPRIFNLETIEEASEEGNINNARETEIIDNSVVVNVNKEENSYVAESINIKKKKKKSKKHLEVADYNDDHPAINIQVDMNCVKKEGKSKKSGNKKIKMNDDIDIIKQDEECRINKENIVDAKTEELSKLERKQYKDKNKNLEYKLKTIKDTVQNNDDEGINTVVQENIISENYNISDENKIPNKEVKEKEINTETQLQNVELKNINPKENISNSIDTTIRINCSKESIRVSKRMMRSFFHLNYVSDFPGSNINEIKGYGTDLI